MKNKIYIHVAACHEGNEILKKLLEKIHESGLYDYVSEINLVINGNADFINFSDHKKYNFSYENKDLTKAEFPTLVKLWNDSRASNFNVLYLHTKGAFRSGSKIRDWVEYLSYFNIERWKCITKYLGIYDGVGVNLISNSKGMNDQLKIAGLKTRGLRHYSGNFWWSRADYIRKLQNPENLFNGDYKNKGKMKKIYRYMAEAWIGTGEKEESLKSVFNSKTNHYLENYSRAEYDGAEWK